MAVTRSQKSEFHSKADKVYKLLRELEIHGIKNQTDPFVEFQDIEDFHKLDTIRNFLQAIPEDLEQKKLQEIIYHFKRDSSLRQLEFFLIPFERFLGKNLKDDDFITLKSDQLHPRKKFPICILLENIRSSFNVGSFFRLADGLGASHIYLCGYSPHPSKTAMGSETSVPYSMESKALPCIHELKKEGFRIIGFETTTLSISYTEKYLLNKKYCFIFGNERFGINQDTLRHCDEIRQIPMYGIKNSMNVAVCGGIVLGEWVRQYVSSAHAD